MSAPEEALIDARYALAELLGVGGSASVFVADDLHTGVRVAVKLLHPHLCADPETRAAFLAEADRATRLRDPHIVRVRGAGLHEAGGVVMPWIALDLARGPTLREYVEAHGPLPLADAVALARGVLAGLAVAHAEGIVHRDISPQNIVLDDRTPSERGGIDADAVRILDFGLADLTGRTTVGGDILLAGEGRNVIGNAHYMSPEQAQGQPVRAASDLYQVGAVLYFAATGAPPFPRSTTQQVLEAQVSAPPPVPSALVPSARPLDRIVTRAMTKTPARRFRDAAEFDAALADIPLARAGAEIDAHGEDDAGHAATAVTRMLPEQRVGTLDYLSPVPASAPSPAARTRGGGLAAAATAVAVVIGLGIWVAMSAAGRATSAAPSASPSASVAPEPTPTSAPTPSATETRSNPAPSPPPPATVAVPALFGLLSDAERALTAVGLAVGSIARVSAPDPAGTVLGQNPPVGTPVLPGSSVDITVASGYNTVPLVAGLDAATAAAMLESAGFAVSGRPADDRIVVTGTQPAAGAVVRIGVSITMRVADVSTPSPSPSGSPRAVRGAP